MAECFIGDRYICPDLFQLMLVSVFRLGMKQTECFPPE